MQWYLCNPNRTFKKEQQIKEPEKEHLGFNLSYDITFAPEILEVNGATYGH